MGSLNNEQKIEMAKLGPERLSHLVTQNGLTSRRDLLEARGINNGPIDQADYDIAIKFWVQEGTLEIAQNIFAAIPHVEVESIDDYLKFEKEANYFTREEIQNLKELIDAVDSPGHARGPYHYSSKWS